MSRFVRVLAAVAVAAAAAGVAACGSNRAVALPESGATLTGTIKYGPDQLQYANVLVRGAGDGVAMGVILDDGTYTVENAPLGEVKVGVLPKASYGRYMSHVMSGGAYTGPEGKGRKKVNLKFLDVPDQFYDPETSGLTTTVVKGTNTFDIVIAKPKTK